MVHSERVERLNDQRAGPGDYVLYWMQASQRAEDNKALRVAIEKANAENLPLLTYFGLTDDFPEGNLRHYHFMIEGLKETLENLKEMGIKTVITHL
ncbi:MAG: deoxyribodipyrimidine photo-lyase, partial [Candidatus Bipolaricaulota bacterium]